MTLSDLDGLLAVITRYFTQSANYRRQPFSSTVNDKMESSFLAMYGLWGTTRTISAVAEFLVIKYADVVQFENTLRLPFVF